MYRYVGYAEPQIVVVTIPAMQQIFKTHVHQPGAHWCHHRMCGKIRICVGSSAQEGVAGVMNYDSESEWSARRQHAQAERGTDWSRLVFEQRTQEEGTVHPERVRVARFVAKIGERYLPRFPNEQGVCKPGMTRISHPKQHQQ